MTAISVVVTAHNEGLLLCRSIASASLAAQEAEKNGFDTEILLGLDTADVATEQIAHELANSYHIKVFSMKHGDVGLARNELIQSAQGDYVAILDGDDFWGRNWLHYSAKFSLTLDGDFVLHPEANVYFGQRHLVFRHPDMLNASFEIAGLAAQNYWTSLSFARRSTFLQIPYRASDIDGGFGYEDWSWNVDTICAGYLHRVVRGTYHAIRAKHTNSLVRRSSKANCLPRFSNQFARVIVARRNP